MLVQTRRRAALPPARPRRLWAGLLLIVLLLSMATLAAHTMLGAVLVARAAPDLTAPTLEELDATIARAGSFVEGLYKPIDADGSSVAEYYAFPLRAYLVSDDVWRLAGEDRAAFCEGWLCYKTTEVYPTTSLERSERFSVEIRSPRARYSPLLDVEIDWDASETQYAARVTNARFDDTATNATLYLGDILIGTFGQTNIGQTTTLLFDKSDRQQLQSFRYTIRHGNQDGQNYYWYRQDLDKYQKLAAFQERWGFGLDYDLRGPIWGHGTTYPDDMMFDATGAGGYEAFHDCAVRLPMTERSYPYQSKVCKATPEAYVALSRFDPLSPTIQALHLLNKYHDPLRPFSLGWSQGWTPTAAAADLEAKFDRLGFGMPMCSPASCNTQLASAIRTFQFGALETRLGYEYNRERSRTYADATARLAVQAQVTDDLIVRTVDGDYYRPAQRGGFYLSWDAERRYRLDRPVPYRQLDEGFNMPAEYRGVVVTNMETVHDAFAFLVLYRCKKYGVGCSTAPVKLSDRPAPGGQLEQVAHVDQGQGPASAQYSP